LHGSARVKQDLGICYSRTPANLAALAAALAGFRPTLRGAPPDLPFRVAPPTLKSGLNFTGISMAMRFGSWISILSNAPSAPRAV
jgi:hypothetical protein